MTDSVKKNRFLNFVRFKCNADLSHEILTMIMAYNLETICENVATLNERALK